MPRVEERPVVRGRTETVASCALHAFSLRPSSRGGQPAAAYTRLNLAPVAPGALFTAAHKAVASTQGDAAAALVGHGSNVRQRTDRTHVRWCNVGLRRGVMADSLARRVGRTDPRWSLDAGAAHLARDLRKVGVSRSPERCGKPDAPGSVLMEGPRPDRRPGARTNAGDPA